MRRFDYFLYGDCPVEICADNPRAWFDAETDAILTEIVKSKPGRCDCSAVEERFSAKRIENLIQIGLLRRENDALWLDSPVLLEEDVAAIENGMAECVARMAQLVLNGRSAIEKTVKKLQNGFSVEENLYHLLCAATFDGHFFDLLFERGVVSTSRRHESGLDYLIIVYEKSPVLERFSRKLLCSYNRMTDGARALQSFGDSDGNRKDFYRFNSLRASKRLEDSAILRAWNELPEQNFAQKMLDAAEDLANVGECDSKRAWLLEQFGYTSGGKLAVPVYRSADLACVSDLTALMDEYLYEEMRSAIAEKTGLVCAAHDVAAGEIANEMYHIAFGMLNERLIRSGFAATPREYPGEGRYLKSIQLK